VGGKKQAAEDHRTGRLDALHQAIWPKALAGDVGAVHAILKIMEHRGRLLGLETPAKADRVGEQTLVIRYVDDWRGDGSMLRPVESATDAALAQPTAAEHGPACR
jgi:hypothetical protein